MKRTLPTFLVSLSLCLACTSAYPDAPIGGDPADLELELGYRTLPDEPELPGQPPAPEIAPPGAEAQPRLRMARGLERLPYQIEDPLDCPAGDVTGVDLPAVSADGTLFAALIDTDVSAADFDGLRLVVAAVESGKDVASMQIDSTDFYENEVGCGRHWRTVKQRVAEANAFLAAHQWRPLRGLGTTTEDEKASVEVALRDDLIIRRPGVELFYRQWVADSYVEDDGHCSGEPYLAGAYLDADTRTMLVEVGYVTPCMCDEDSFYTALRVPERVFDVLGDRVYEDLVAEQVW